MITPTRGRPAATDTNRIMRGPPPCVTPQVKEWYAEQLFVTCCHEAGHAVVAHRMGCSEIVIHITSTLAETSARGGAGVQVATHGSTQSIYDLNDHFGAMVVTFGGPLAEPGPGTSPLRYPTDPPGGKATGTDLVKIKAYRRSHGSAETRRAESLARTLLRQEHEVVGAIATELFGRGAWLGSRYLDVSALLGANSDSPT